MSALIKVIVEDWWVSCRSFTAWCRTARLEGSERGCMITDAAPLIKTFRGQQLGKLLEWARRKGSLQYQRLNTPGTTWYRP